MDTNESDSVRATGDRTVYAVWIHGQGWLKQNAENPQSAFVSLEIEVAETAARLWGAGARVLPFDGSLLDFEPRFLEREGERTLGYRLKAWLKRAVSS